MTLATNPADEDELSPRAAAARSVWRFMGRNPLGAAGAVIVAVLSLVALFAPLLAPYDPYELHADILLHAPSASHWMGTDEFGRDVLSRIIWGARISLFIGLIAVGLGTTGGAVFGLISGYFGGKTDYIIQRVTDSLMAVPVLVLALAMVAVLGASVGNVIVALAIVISPNSCRVIRSCALSLREAPFVDAARNLGYSHARILFRHVLPNCAAPFIVIATAAVGSAILSEAALSFLGLGSPPPEPSWGAMLSGKTQRFMIEAPWLAIFPGLAITIVVFGFNFLGDALRDTLDPRLRGR